METVWSRERFIGGPRMPPKALKKPMRFQQSILKDKVREGCDWLWQTSWFGILCSWSCPPWSGQDIPINLQQGKRYSLC